MIINSYLCFLFNLVSIADSMGQGNSGDNLNHNIIILFILGLGASIIILDLVVNFKIPSFIF